jgi:putative transposase
MQRFESDGSTLKLLSAHAAVFKSFNVPRRPTAAQTRRTFRAAAMRTWLEATVTCKSERRKP